MVQSEKKTNRKYRGKPGTDGVQDDRMATRENATEREKR